jgi:hypothetical protein
MSNNYDSVLKEKKKYVDYVDDRPFIRRHLFLVNIFAILIILVISFVIYFNTTLSSKNIVLNDIDYFYNKFNSLYKNTGISNIDDIKFNGDLSLEVDSNYDNIDDMNILRELKFNYSLISNDNNKYYSINNDDYSFSYLEKGGKAFLTTSDMNVMYNINSNNDNKDINDIIDNLKLDKQTFTSDGKIVVSVSFSVDGNIVNDYISSMGSNYSNILKMFNMRMDNNIKYDVTVKNDIFTNDIVSIKVVRRDNNNRGVLLISDNTFTYSDDNDNNYKGVFDIKNDSFMFKFYNDEDLKFVISGKGNDNSYVYNYQVINVVDNAAIQIKKEKNKTVYTINIKKEKEDKYLNILATVSNDNTSIDINKLEFLNNNFISYDKLSDDDKERFNNYIYRYYNRLNNLFNYVNNG